MNRGLVKGLGPQGWIPYATNEGIRVIDATVTAPNLGSGGREWAVYRVDNDVVHFSMNARWFGTGKTAGSGTYVMPLPPVGGYPYTNPMGNMTYAAVFMGGDAFAIRNMQYAGLAGAGTPGTTVPLARGLFICPQRYAVTEEGASGGGARASMAAGLQGVQVTHGIGVPPVGISVTPATDPSVSGMIGWNTLQVGTSSFTIKAYSQGRTVTDAVTNGTTTVTSASANFGTYDLNKVVYGTADIRQQKLVTASVSNGSPNVTSISPSLTADEATYNKGFFGPGTGAFTVINSQAGSSAVLNLNATDTVAGGDFVVDTPTTITAINSSSSITISQAAIGSHAGQTLHIGGRGDGKLAGEQRFTYLYNGPVNGPSLTGLFVNDHYPWAWGSVDSMTIEVEGWYPLNPPGPYL